MSYVICDMSAHIPSHDMISLLPQLMLHGLPLKKNIFLYHDILHWVMIMLFIYYLLNPHVNMVWKCPPYQHMKNPMKHQHIFKYHRMLYQLHGQSQYVLLFNIYILLHFPIVLYIYVLLRKSSSVRCIMSTNVMSCSCHIISCHVMFQFEFQDEIMCI